jgi:hypothetical protein
MGAATADVVTNLEAPPTCTQFVPEPQGRPGGLRRDISATSLCTKIRPKSPGGKGSQ